MDEHITVAAGGPDLNLATVADELQAAGWDVFLAHAGCELAARLEPAPAGRVWSLVVDGSGRWRFRSVHDLSVRAGQQAQIEERKYRLLRTEQRILTVAGRLDASTDLLTVLEDIKALALDEGVVQVSSS